MPPGPRAAWFAAFMCQPDLTPVDAVVSVHGVLSHRLTADRATDRVEMLAAAGAVRIEVQPVGDPFAARIKEMIMGKKESDDWSI